MAGAYGAKYPSAAARAAAILAWIEEQRRTNPGVDAGLRMVGAQGLGDPRGGLGGGGLRQGPPLEPLPKFDQSPPPAYRFTPTAKPAPPVEPTPGASFADVVASREAAQAAISRERLQNIELLQRQHSQGLTDRDPAWIYSRTKTSEGPARKLAEAESKPVGSATAFDRWFAEQEVARWPAATGPRKITDSVQMGAGLMSKPYDAASQWERSNFARGIQYDNESLRLEAMRRAAAKRLWELQQKDQ